MQDLQFFTALFAIVIIIGLSKAVPKNEYSDIGLTTSNNLKVAKRGGGVSKIAKESYEMQTGHSAITSENALDRRYVDMDKQLKEK